MLKGGPNGLIYNINNRFLNKLGFFSNLNVSEAVTQRCSVKRAFLKIYQNSQENTCARVSLFKKDTLAQVFPYEFWGISKDMFFTEFY